MVENPRVAQIFDEMADCLEFKGANPFRVRAYRNAARLIRGLPRPVGALTGKGDLEELPGIGEDLADKIRVIAATGDHPLHRTLLREVPGGLRELMNVPGMGPKRAALLHKKLRVSTLGELRAAAGSHRISRLKGFGEKSELAVLRGLGGLERGAGLRVLLAQARPYAEALVAHLKGARGVLAAEAAGSYRRRRETVGDLDLLVAGDAAAAMERLAGYDAVEDVLARGPTKMTVRLHNGLQVDLRAVPEESFGSALLYFTGSKDHNIQLRARAQARKLKLNEYGVFHGRRRLAGRTEEDVYDALGLPWIPPELREGRGEVGLALAGALPRLLETGDIRGDLHVHTDATDGRDSLEDMVEAARERGYEYVAITDHSQRVAVARGLDAERLMRHWARIDRLAAKTPGLALLKGVEVDILDDGSLDIPDAVLEGADWVVASLHYGQRQPREKITRRLLSAVENPVVSAIGHPTGRLIGRRPPQSADLGAVMRAAAAHGCALELNAQPDRLDLDDVALAAAKDRGVMIAVDSDAHSARELGFMEYGVFQARRGGLTSSDVVNSRPLARLRKLRRRR